jgi:hypothetical protein
MKEETILRPRFSIRSALGSIFALLLHRGKTGARIRLVITVLAFMSYWFALAYIIDPLPLLPTQWVESLPFPIDLLGDLFSSLFAPQVLLHILPVIAGVWLGFRIGSHYLSDLFELEPFSVNARYLRSSLFGVNYPTLEVDTSKSLALNPNAPLIRIGGSGYFTLHLGSAAVFESIDGSTQVLGSRKAYFVEGFTRLKQVIDLRDQLRKLDEIRAVTRDGIEVHARDAQMVFRIYSGDRARSREDPYPFSEDAIRRLVFGLPVAESGQTKWDQVLSDLVRREIQNFISALTIEEFLAMQPQNLAYQPAADDSDSARMRSAPATFHIPRSELTKRFHTPETRQRLSAAGLELDWVGVGTWEIRDPASPGITPRPSETLISTWRNLQRSKFSGSPEYLHQIKELNARQYAGRLFRQWIDTWKESAIHSPHRCWKLLNQINNDLEAMGRGLIGVKDLKVPLDYQQVIHHLRKLSEAEELGRI